MEILQLLLVSSTTEEWLEKKAGKKKNEGFTAGLIV